MVTLGGAANMGMTSDAEPATASGKPPSVSGSSSLVVQSSSVKRKSVKDRLGIKKKEVVTQTEETEEMEEEHMANRREGGREGGGEFTYRCNKSTSLRTCPCVPVSLVSLICYGCGKKTRARLSSVAPQKA